MIVDGFRSFDLLRLAHVNDIGSLFHFFSSPCEQWRGRERVEELSVLG